jgi:hypothetical protein
MPASNGGAACPSSPEAVACIEGACQVTSYFWEAAGFAPCPGDPVSPGVEPMDYRYLGSIFIRSLTGVTIGYHPVSPASHRPRPAHHQSRRRRGRSRAARAKPGLPSDGPAEACGPRAASRRAVVCAGTTPEGERFTAAVRAGPARPGAVKRPQHSP